MDISDLNVAPASFQEPMAAIVTGVHTWMNLLSERLLSGRGTYFDAILSSIVKNCLRTEKINEAKNIRL